MPPRVFETMDEEFADGETDEMFADGFKKYRSCDQCGVRIRYLEWNYAPYCTAVLARGYPGCLYSVPDYHFCDACFAWKPDRYCQFHWQWISEGVNGVLTRDTSGIVMQYM